jgi:hypothetical protein
MEALGISLIVAGMAFFCSGLIFLLPSKKKYSGDERSFGQDQAEEIVGYNATKDSNQPANASSIPRDRASRPSHRSGDLAGQSPFNSA